MVTNEVLSVMLNFRRLSQSQPNVEMMEKKDNFIRPLQGFQ